jgi:glucose-6-phosphate 1-dehydrogenase
LDFGANTITFELQPQEKISLKFLVKTPGLENSLEEQTLNFKHLEKASQKKSEAYEKVLYDAIVGDQTLFPSPEEIEYSWRFITPIINHWTDLPLHKYKLGVDTDKIEFES